MIFRVVSDREVLLTVWQVLWESEHLDHRWRQCKERQQAWEVPKQWREFSNQLPMKSSPPSRMRVTMANSSEENYERCWCEGTTMFLCGLYVTCVYKLNLAVDKVRCCHFIMTWIIFKLKKCNEKCLYC